MTPQERATIVTALKYVVTLIEQERDAPEAAEPAEGDASRMARALITLHEGKRNKLYQDSLGIATIGIGHNIQDRGLSDAAIDFIFREDLQQAERDAIAWLGADAWAKLDDVRKAALIDFSFNLGAKTLAEFKVTREALRSGGYGPAAHYMTQSRWAEQVGKRAQRITEMIRTGQMPGDVPGLPVS